MSKNEKQVYLQCKACRCFVPFDYDEWCPYCGEEYVSQREKGYLTKETITFTFSGIEEKNQFILENWLKSIEVLSNSKRKELINSKDLSILKENIFRFREILLRCKDLHICFGKFEKIYLEYNGTLYLYFPSLLDNKVISILDDMISHKETLPNEFHFSSFFTPIALKKIKETEVSKENV